MLCVPLGVRAIEPLPACHRSFPRSVPERRRCGWNWSVGARAGSKWYPEAHLYTHRSFPEVSLSAPKCGWSGPLGWAGPHAGRAVFSI
jgi:hypothetical protein